MIYTMPQSPLSLPVFLMHSHWKPNAQQMADIWNTFGPPLVRAGDLPCIDCFAFVFDTWKG